MYALVADIPEYGNFLPWCGGSRVLSDEGGQTLASIEILYKGIHKTFTTRNRPHPFEMIEIELVDGPFSHLQGDWKFVDLKEGVSRISLNLEFEFSSRFLSILVGPIFSQIANNLVDAFRRRAHEIYGSTDRTKPGPA